MVTRKKPKRHRPASVEDQSEDSFPASDPPSFAGGDHIIGAPVERKTKPATASSVRVREAEEKVKRGEHKKPHVY